MLTLGRMRSLESISTLVASLESGPEGDAVAGIRALGLVGTPEAGAAIIVRLARPFPSPREAVRAALITCFRSDPALLVQKTLSADDGLRPLLARVLAEVAVPGIPDGWSTLALDPLSEVRAAAARVLAVVRPSGASMILGMLAEDREWFVRLRATAALGELADPGTIPILIERLCDTNRLVRLRAASALGRIRGEETHILALAGRRGDRYALQALVSEFQRSGVIVRLVDGLAGPCAPLIQPVLLSAAQAGAVRLLAGLAVSHDNPLVRHSLLEILGQVREPSARDYFEGAIASGQVPALLGEKFEGTEEPGVEIPSPSRLSALLGSTEAQIRAATQPVAAP